MLQSFWQTLPKPIIGLSPMDGVTDHPFRHVQKHVGRPDIIMTEFTSAEGVAHNAVKLFDDFLYDETQRPAIAQIFGKDARSFYVTAVILGFLGYDGIDINMGCPAKSVEQHGAGAALIRTPDIAQDIVRATRKGIQDWANGITLEQLPELKQKTIREVMSRHAILPDWAKQRRELPISVKTRIGYDQVIIRDWIRYLLETEPVAITVHGRTLKQLYSGSANWEAIAQAVDEARGSGTKILGNGDITTLADFHSKVTQSGVDGALIGRATFGNPWFIRDLVEFRDQHWSDPNARQIAQDWAPSEISWEERVAVILEHTKLYLETFPDHHFLAMRKHLGWYIKGFPHASEMRNALVRSNSLDEVQNILSRAPVVQ